MTRSVIVFDIDGLSIRSAGCYGNVETPTPLLNEFAAQARVFEQHYRMFVDPDRDRDMLFDLLRGEFSSGLRVATTPTESKHDVVTTQTLGEVAAVLENQFDTEGQVALVRLGAESGYIDTDFPLSLISQLIEAGVGVAVTSSCPVSDVSRHQVRNEEMIRVPLMIWCQSAQRVQGVTSGCDLPDMLSESAVAGDSAIVQSHDVAGLRESDAMMLVSRELLGELQPVEDDDLLNSISVTDDRLQLFRKPDDVWNVHNIVVEDVQRATTMLARLRRELSH